MTRIAGVDIPEGKPTQIALTYIMGIGHSNVQKALKSAQVKGDKRVKKLTAEEVKRLQRVISKYPTEDELRHQVRVNIQRLKRIDSYKGLRHEQNLPVRGQQTRTNARTKRGKRQTVGAIKKKQLTKMQKTKRKDE